MTGSSAETRPLAGVLEHDSTVDMVVNIGLAVRNNDDLRPRQLLIEKLMQRFRRPFHVNAVGVFSLEPKLGQHGLDVPSDRQLRRPRAVGCATEIEIGDRKAKRLRPPSQQGQHDRCREQPDPGGDADQGERHVEFGLVRPTLDERQVVDDEQRPLTLLRGQRKERERDSRAVAAHDLERVDLGKRRARTMRLGRHFLRRVEHFAVGAAEAERKQPLILHQLLKVRFEIAFGFRRKPRRDALLNGSVDETRTQLNVALRPFIDDHRSHLGHRGDDHR